MLHDHGTNMRLRLFITVAFVSTLSWFIRYRYLNMYTRLPPEPQRKEPHVDLFPDTQEEGTKSGLSSYLDEFLSAIKVFGYLERPVFHELTRTMQTRKLIAGETLNLEEEKGFCLVVDGLVEIFVKSPKKDRHTDGDISMHNTDHASTDSDDEEENYGHQGYQLLTEVKNGAPMSSLFSILSLFTEDVKLRHEDEDDEPQTSNSSMGGHMRARAMSDMDPNVDFPPSEPTIPRDETGTADGENGKRARLSSIPPMSLDQTTDGAAPPPTRPKMRRMQTNSVHPDIIARATVDTTIAIIPASAFRRLTRIYPKATSHIVQVILTRLQRVTLATGHSYLGLTAEVLRTERDMNKYTTYELPNFLRGDALDRLKEKFLRERERIGQEDSKKGIALHNSGAGRKESRRRSSSIRKDATLHAANSFAQSSRKSSTMSSQLSPIPDGGVSPSPGDLLTNIHSQRNGGLRNNHPVMSPGAPFEQSVPNPGTWRHPVQTPLSQSSFNPFNQPNVNVKPTLHRQESLDEDSIFRGSILECIFKAIGLTITQNALKMTDSVEASPMPGPLDGRKRGGSGAFTNVFGFIDPYEGSVDGDTESVASSSFSTHTPITTSKGLATELRDEVEIVYFPKGSVLVEQGERNPGLYYVIDGFLDVGIPSHDQEEGEVLGGRPSGRGSFASQKSTSKFNRSSSKGPGGLGSDFKRRKPTGRKTLSLIKPGGIAGYIGTISSYRSFIDVTAKTDVYVGFLPRSSLERIVEKYPIVLLTMAKRLTSLLPKLILHIDFALEWVQVNAGQVIYHQGDESDAIYIVLNGRLRAVVNNEDDSETKVIGEYGQGESVGELEVMTESERPATLHAIRDTELAKFPKTLFNSLAQEHPGITIKISKIIASRMRALIDDPVFLGNHDKTKAATNKKVSSNTNLRTVAIIPVTGGVPVADFGSRLINALTQIGAPGGVTSLNQAAILNHLGRHAFSRMGKLKLSQYLADLEEKYGLVLYIAGKLDSFLFYDGIASRDEINRHGSSSHRATTFNVKHSIFFPDNA